MMGFQMKRDYLKKYGVSKHFPLFIWKKCTFCDQEFIRESGFKWPHWNFHKYACSKCCASVSHCSDMILHKHDTMIAQLSGKIPPSPPMRTYRSK